MRKFTLIITILSISISSHATTWFLTEHTCPVCGEKKTYQEISSYGGYTYSWPSKYEYIYWPLTDNPSVYCCVDCHFSTFMWDSNKKSKDENAKGLDKYLTDLIIQYKEFIKNDEEEED